MTLALYPAWSVERDGSLEITINGSTVYVNAGHFAHVSMGVHSVADFATQLTATLASVGAGFVATFDTATSLYTIDRGGSSFTIAYSGNPASERMFNVLGGVPAGTATSFVGAFVPVYAIRPAMQVVSNWTGFVEPDTSERREVDSGESYAVGATTKPLLSGWDFTNEPKGAVMSYDIGAIAGRWWTWQDLWAHAGRYQEPIAITWPHFVASGGGSWIAFRLVRPDFGSTTHSLMQADWDALWRIRIEASDVRFIGAP
jgi:hypothetical protein